MESLQTTKSSSKKSIQEATIPKPIQVISHPFVGDGSHNQKSAKPPEQAKQQEFNLGQIPIFPRSSQKDDQASGNLSEDDFDVEDVEKYLEEVRNFISQSELRNTNPQELAEIAKEPQQSSQKDDQASGNLSEDDFNVDDIKKSSKEASNHIIESEMRNARPQELAEVANEKDSVLAPIAQQMVMSSEGQEQGGSPPPENLTTEQPEASSSSRSERQEPQPSTQSEVEQIIEQKLNKAETDIEQAEAVASAVQSQQKPAQTQTPPTQEQQLSAGLKPLRLVQEQKQKQRLSTQTPPTQEQQLSAGLKPLRLVQEQKQKQRLSTRVPQTGNQQRLSGGLKPLRLVQEHQQSLQAPESIQVPEQEQQPLERPPKNLLQQTPNYPPPLSPPQIEQEVQQLLNMDRAPRQQRLLQLHQQQRHRPEIMDALIQQLQTALNEQQSETEPYKAVNTVTDKPTEETQKNTGQQDRKQVATGIRQYEAWADATGILGQPSGELTVDNQVLGQNLDANSSAQGYSYPTFKDDSSVIDMTRDNFKAASGLLLFADSAKQLKAVLKDKKKKAHERIAIASNSLGEMTQAITYSTISINQGVQGGKNLRQTGSANLGALAAAKQGGTIAGTSLPTDIGKTVGGVLTTIPKLIIHTDAGVKAYKENRLGDYKSWGRGFKNVADTVQSAAGAVKDASSLVQHLRTASNATKATANAVKIYSGGLTAPMANAVGGVSESVQGVAKLAKAQNNNKRLDEIKSKSSGEHGETLDRLKEKQKKKMTSGGIDLVLGGLKVAAGVAGFSRLGAPGLVTATAIGGAVGAIQIGLWGTRKFKQYMRDRAESQAGSQEGIFDTSKSTKNKEAANKKFAVDVVNLINNGINSEIDPEAARDKESIFSSIGLNGDKKKDNAVQNVYNDVLKKYLNDKSEEYITKKLQEMAKQGTVKNITETREKLHEEFLNQEDIQGLEQRGHEQNLKQDVTWNNLYELPEDFQKRLEGAAIVKALKKR
ncbi:MAG: hypothetical protein KME55_37285 [Nostoc indistinguendum CM1-VF10]|jgi:hypothetical protein|nr:hypothetical protein [Nostoc indistinguendum CM1-VF10]